MPIAVLYDARGGEMPTPARNGHKSAVVAGSVAICLLMWPLLGRAVAGKLEDSKEYLDKAAAAFALHRYAVAAENFEKAFELSPDPALLYNAAQSHRLAGSKQRALDLYQSYLQMYGSEKREEIEKHVEDLKKAIEQDHAVATSPPVTTEPTKETVDLAPPGAGTSTPPSMKQGAIAPVLVSQQSTAPATRPLTRRGWFWAAVGGGVVMTAAVILLLSLSGEGPAMASIGRVPGN